MEIKAETTMDATWSEEGTLADMKHRLEKLRIDQSRQKIEGMFERFCHNVLEIIFLISLSPPPFSPPPFSPPPPPNPPSSIHSFIHFSVWFCLLFLSFVPCFCFVFLFFVFVLVLFTFHFFLSSMHYSFCT